MSSADDPQHNCMKSAAPSGAALFCVRESGGGGKGCRETAEGCGEQWMEEGGDSCRWSGKEVSSGCGAVTKAAAVRRRVSCGERKWRGKML